MDVDGTLKNHGKRIRHLEELEEIMSNIRGWDGSAWRKLPLVWGYSESMSEEVVDTNATVTADAINTTAVPEGEIYVVQAVCARDDTTNITSIGLYAVVGGVSALLHHATVTAAGEWVYWTGEVAIPEDGYIRAYFTGTVAGDDIRLRICGYKMNIAE